MQQNPKYILSMCDFGKTEDQKIDVYREWVTVVDGITLIPSIRPNNTWENKEAFCEGKKWQDLLPSVLFPLTLWLLVGMEK